MEIVTREQAIERDVKRYFTGKPCSRGHISDRLVSNRSCMECASAARKRYYAEDPVKYRDRYKEWFSKPGNSEKRRSSFRDWRAANLEADRERCRKKIARIRKENPEALRMSDRRKRAKREMAVGSHTLSDVADIMRMQKNKCAYCRVTISKKYHVDHIVSLSRGGTDYRNNLQVLCAHCNTTKHATDPVKFAQSLGRLL